MNEQPTYTFIEALENILKRWKTVVFIPLAAGILAIAIGFLMPKWYRAEAQVMPPYSAGGDLSNITGMLGGIMGLAGEGSFTLPMMVTPTDLWGGMVKAPGIADSIINRFNLIERYKCKHLANARIAYENHLYVDIGGEGLLTVGYEDKDPQSAADITNAIIDVLDRTLQEVHVTSAKRTREFVETRLAQCDSALTAAEDALAKFQNTNRAISLEDQAKVAVENVAQLYAQLSMLEVQIGAMKQSGAQYTPDMSQLQAQATEMRRKINQLEQKGDKLMLGIPINKYPDLILEYARFYRDLKIQELLYEMIRQQYEQARIEEQRNTLTLHVLSRAVPPDKKLRPKKALMGLGTMVGVGIIVILWLLWLGYLEKLKRIAPEQYQRIVGFCCKKKQ